MRYVLAVLLLAGCSVQPAEPDMAAALPDLAYTPPDFARPTGGCGKDVNCKGDRICVQGTCVDAPQDLAQPDMTERPDLETVDLQRPDLATPDLMPAPDLAEAPDLDTPPDLTEAPDLMQCIAAVGPLAGCGGDTPCCSGRCQSNAGTNYPSDYCCIDVNQPCPPSQVGKQGDCCQGETCLIVNGNTGATECR